MLWNKLLILGLLTYVVSQGYDYELTSITDRFQCTFDNGTNGVGFEPKTCGFNLFNLRNKITSRWQVRKGQSFSSIEAQTSSLSQFFTGPEGDHTHDGAGYYLSFDSSPYNPQDGEILYQSPENIAELGVFKDHGEPYCAVYFLNHYSSQVDTGDESSTFKFLRVLNDGTLDGQEDTLDTIVGGNSQDVYIPRIISIPATPYTSQLQFYGKAHPDQHFQDFFIDDFTLYPFSCDNINMTSGLPMRIISQWGDWTDCSGWCGMGNKERRRTCISEPCNDVHFRETQSCMTGCRLAQCPEYEFGDCNWEDYDDDRNVKCNIVKEESDTFWKVATSVTTPGTGPNKDHTFKDLGCPGHFIHIEASDMKEGESAVLVTPVEKTVPICFRFYLSMRAEPSVASEMGSFRVYLWQSQLKTIIYEHTGVLPSTAFWHPIELTITSNMLGNETGDFTVVMEAIRGSGERSDIAVDDVTIRDGACLGPVPGFWSEWSQWVNNNLSCGAEEFEIRKRECNSPAASGSGPSCPGLAEETRLLQPCPVQGGWSNYSALTACSATCGDGGLRYKYRECNSPKPVGNISNWCHNDDGNPALYEEIEEDCNSTLPVCNTDGKWSAWALSECTVSCGSGTGTFRRRCDNPAKSGNGTDCDYRSGGFVEGEDETGKYQNKTGVACNTQPCPVDGGFGQWGLWGSEAACFATCGSDIHGNQFMESRSRLCNNPAPQHNGADCSGDLVETRSCGPKDCPINGNWGGWIIAPCSLTCGEVILQDVRYCNDPAPQFGGLDCKGNVETGVTINETRPSPCGNKQIACPVNGTWSAWTAYTPCDSSCGIHYSTRMKTCNNPARVFPGLDCEGEGSGTPKIQTVFNRCNTSLCPDLNACTFKAGSSCNFKLNHFIPSRWTVVKGAKPSGPTNGLIEANEVDHYYLHYDSSMTSSSGASYTDRTQYVSLPITQIKAQQLLCLAFHIWTPPSASNPPSQFYIDQCVNQTCTTIYVFEGSLLTSWQFVMVNVPKTTTLAYTLRFYARSDVVSMNWSLDGFRFFRNAVCNADVRNEVLDASGNYKNNYSYP